MPQRDYGLMEPGRSPWWCIRRARINARFRMAANTRLKSKPIIVQTKPTQPFPLSITIPINSPCMVTLVRAPPGSSEAAEGKILVPTLLFAATCTQLFVSRVKLKPPRSSYARKGAISHNRNSRSHLVSANKGSWSRGVSVLEDVNGPIHASRITSTKLPMCFRLCWVKEKCGRKGCFGGLFFPFAGPGLQLQDGAAPKPWAGSPLFMQEPE